MSFFDSKSLILLIFFLSQQVFAVSEDEQCIPSKSEKNYQRIVSIGGDITEILYALGCENRIVAVDTSSLYPKSALKTHPNVGYLRTISAEPILALNPDLVIAIEAVQPSIVLDQLRSTGVNIVVVPDEKSMDGIYKKVRIIGDALAITEQANVLMNFIKTSYNNVINQLLEIESQPRVAFLLQSGHGASMVAGKKTSADEIIKLAGAVNVFQEFKGYKPVNAEAMIKKKPDYVLITERALAEIGSKEDVLRQAEIRLAIDNDVQRLIVMDDLLLLGFGPRTPQAIQQLASMIHKELIN